MAGAAQITRTVGPPQEDNQVINFTVRALQYFVRYSAMLVKKIKYVSFNILISQ